MRVFARGAERVEVAVDDRAVTVRRFRGEVLVDEAREEASSAIKAKWDADRRCKRLVADGFARVAGTDELVASQRDLVAAIEADPADLDTYLVLADWLAERGDSWGQLIAVQHAMASLPRFGSAERRAELEREEVRVLFQHASRIWGALGETIVDEGTQRYASDLVEADWRCGFLFSARLHAHSVELWERLLPTFASLEIMAVLRVLWIDLAEDPKRMLELVARERWPRLTSLAIAADGEPIDAIDLLPLIHAGHAPELVSLDLHRTTRTGRFCAMLAAEPIAKRLETLVLRDGDFTDGGLVALGHFPALEQLEISGRIPREPDVRAMLAGRVRHLLIEPFAYGEEGYEE